MVRNLDFNKIRNFGSQELIELVTSFFKEGKPKKEKGIYSMIRLEDAFNSQNVWWIKQSLDAISQSYRTISQTYLGRINNIFTT